MRPKTLDHHARRHYSWQRIVQRVAQVYAQTIADNARTASQSAAKSAQDLEDRTLTPLARREPGHLTGR